MTSTEVIAALEEQMVKLDSLLEFFPEAANMRNSLSDISESISAFFPDLSTHMRTVKFGIRNLQLRAKGRAIYLYISLSPWISFVHGR